MLGYVTADKNELKIREYEVYQGYYCGICKSIGSRTGQIPRMTLSYDIVFLAILLESLNGEKEDIRPEHCIIHPIKKKPAVRNSRAVDYAADLMVMLAYHKLEDDWNDDRSAKAYAGKTALHHAYMKLQGEYSELCGAMERDLRHLSELEKEHSGSMDSTCDAFADIMEAMFTGYYDDKDVNRILAQLGRNLGRWIYAVDALDDYSEDIEKNQYNPLIYRQNGIEGIDILLYNYLAEVLKAYDLLDIKKNRGIIDNILLMGLRLRTDSIVKEREEDTDGKSI